MPLFNPTERETRDPVNTSKNVMHFALHQEQEVDINPIIFNENFRALAP